MGEFGPTNSHIEQWKRLETEKAETIELRNVTFSLPHHPDEVRSGERETYLVEGDTTLNGVSFRKPYIVEKITDSAGNELTEEQVQQYREEHQKAGIGMKLELHQIHPNPGIQINSRTYFGQFIEN